MSLGSQAQMLPGRLQAPKEFGERMCVTIVPRQHQASWDLDSCQVHPTTTPESCRLCWPPSPVGGHPQEGDSCWASQGSCPGFSHSCSWGRNLNKLSEGDSRCSSSSYLCRASISLPTLKFRAVKPLAQGPQQHHSGKAGDGLQGDGVGRSPCEQIAAPFIQ